MKNASSERGSKVGSRYNVVFSGQLLEGFELRDVRMHAGERMRMSEAQLDKVFSGASVVLKRAVDAAMGARYLAELNQLGMRASLAPEDAPVVTTNYKVSFFGEVLAGFERAAVIAAATQRLRVTPAQATKLFSGAKAVLKRGVSAGTGKRYVDELARIGMRVVLEAESAPATEAAAAQARTPAARPVEIIHPAPVAKPLVSEVQAAGFTDTLFEIPRALTASGLDLPQDDAEQESFDHAATLLVDPMRLVEQLNAIESTAPPMRASTMTSSSTIQRAVETAVAYVSCPRCGHSQPQRDNCRRCGAPMSAAANARMPAPAAPAAAVAASAVPVAPQPPAGLALEPLPVPPPVVVDTPPPPAAVMASPPAPVPVSRPQAVADLRAEAASQESDERADDARGRKRLMIVVAVAALILLWMLFRR